MARGSAVKIARLYPADTFPGSRPAFQIMIVGIKNRAGVMNHLVSRSGQAVRVIAPENSLRYGTVTDAQSVCKCTSCD